MTDNVVGKIKDAVEDVFEDRKTLIRIITVALILIIALVLRLSDAGKPDITVESADRAEAAEQTEAKKEQADSAAVIYVDIGGAVKNPGVYQVANETRLYQVIDMAGGLEEDADTDSVNRASFVEDGQKIIIPVKGGTGVYTAGIGTTAQDPAGTGLININTASADELRTLTGIGDVMAQRIIEYRASKAFKSIEDIMSVDGIGSKIFEKIKDRITC